MKIQSVSTCKVLAGVLSMAMILVVIFSLAGCSGKEIKTSDEPSWVQKGKSAFLDKEQQSFYGIGAVVGIENKSLARSAADKRARAEISKIFETYSASLMRDYAASTTAASFDAVSEEQFVEQSIKSFSAPILRGVMIVDHWADLSDHTYYSLARLDLVRFKNNLDQVKDLNAGVRDFVKQNAEKTFEKLDKEEALRQ